MDVKGNLRILDGTLSVDGTEVEAGPSGGTPGGGFYQVQFNDQGSFGGHEDFIFEPDVGSNAGRLQVPGGDGSTTFGLKFAGTNYGIGVTSNTMRFGLSFAAPAIIIDDSSNEVRVTNDKFVVGTSGLQWPQNWITDGESQEWNLKQSTTWFLRFRNVTTDWVGLPPGSASAPGIRGLNQSTGAGSSGGISFSSNTVRILADSPTRVDLEVQGNLTVEDEAHFEKSVEAGGFYLSTGNDLAVDSIAGQIDSPSIKSYVLDEYAAYDYNVTWVAMRTNAGSGEGGFYINGTSVQGLDPFYFSPTQKRITPLGANTVSEGDRLRFSVVRADDAEDLAFTIRTDR